jgi:hypothetical protein
MMVPDFAANARDRIVAKGMIGALELDGLIAALRRHLEDPNTLAVSSLFIQTWARKPE